MRWIVSIKVRGDRIQWLTDKLKHIFSSPAQTVIRRTHVRFQFHLSSFDAERLACLEYAAQSKGAAARGDRHPSHADMRPDHILITRYGEHSPLRGNNGVSNVDLNRAMAR